MPSGSRGRDSRDRGRTSQSRPRHTPQTTDLAMMVAEKVVGRALTEGDHRRLADKRWMPSRRPIKTRN